jgi:hypothetical protein
VKGENLILTDGLTALGLRLGGDEVRESFYFRQVHLPVQKRPESAEGADAQSHSKTWLQS